MWARSAAMPDFLQLQFSDDDDEKANCKFDFYLLNFSVYNQHKSFQILVKNKWTGEFCTHTQSVNSSLHVATCSYSGSHHTHRSIKERVHLFLSHSTVETERCFKGRAAVDFRVLVSSSHLSVSTLFHSYLPRWSVMERETHTHVYTLWVLTFSIYTVCLCSVPFRVTTLHISPKMCTHKWRMFVCVGWQ